MRVRFFEVNPRSLGFVLRCDQLPAILSVDPGSGQLAAHPADGQPICRLEDVGGQLRYECMSDGDTTLVNDAPLATGPLLPGDRIEIEGHRYVVSYERTSSDPLPEARYRVKPR
jgi:hypothetical protein